MLLLVGGIFVRPPAEKLWVVEPKIEKEKEVESWKTKHTTVTAWMPAFAWCPFFQEVESIMVLILAFSSFLSLTPTRAAVNNALVCV